VTSILPVSHPRRVLLRFVALALVLMALYFAASSTEAYRVAVSQPYLRWTASATGALLRLLSVDGAAARGGLVYAGGFALRVDRGCDASTECAVFAALIIAFPAAFVRKLVAIPSGVAVLVALNIFRVASLVLAGAYTPALFEWLHVEFWQVAFILLAVGLWAAWLPWAIRSSPAVSGLAG